MMSRSRQTSFSHAALLLAATTLGYVADMREAAAQTSGDLEITWEVRNRFRLFREERDFNLHVRTLANQSILASEQKLAVQSEGRGWARNTVNRLCIDAAGKIAEPCVREGQKENYLAPFDHPVTVRIKGVLPVGATCAWTFVDPEGPRQFMFDCAEPINFRARYKFSTSVSVDISSGEGVQHLSTQVMVRDIFIAGLGDSIASGEGNPDRPIALASDGFCFRSYGGGQFYRPSRAGFKGGRTCESYEPLQTWQKQSAQWLNSPCHRSLYSYQARAAIALAARHPRIAVTYLPLACTGATIQEGILGTQQARECLTTRGGFNCQYSIPPQITQLREALATAQRKQPDRKLDLLLLSVGANDIDFSGLVADVIVNGSTERTLFKRAGILGDVDASRTALTRNLPADFVKLRTALKSVVGQDLSRVVYTSYANPALGDGKLCPGGPAGFDIHPAFNADPARLSKVASFVQDEFLPRLKSIARCKDGTICKDPATDALTFVDAHQPAFADHGFCAVADNDPVFDRECFKADGTSFDSDIVSAAYQPMTCDRKASEYRSYLPRARWIRHANDSYFAAMTYPQGLSAIIQPSDIHDATWGLLSAVYGGAIHPTAEGHAAMADAAADAATSVLKLEAPVEISQDKLPPVSEPQD